jgi:3-oxoacyl-[acyl-carrier protein] reductase
MTSAIVTGASAGIGLAITRALCDDGFSVTMVARREERLAAAADELHGGGFDVHPVAVVASADGAAARLVAGHLERCGGIDIVVANAGRGTNGTVADASPTDIAKMLAANVAGPFALARAALPALRVASGWFVITSSMSGVWPTIGSAGYSASKAAAVSLARSIAAEEAADGVRACAICPAFVDTDMTSWLEGSIPTEAMLDPNDVAEAVRFLLRLSPSASITELVLRRVGAADAHAP